MRCARCNRTLLRQPAAEVKTRAGVLSYGPACAENMGLVTPKKRGASLFGGRVRVARRDQRDLFAEAAA